MGDINLNIDRRTKRAVASITNPARFSPLPDVALYDKQKFNIKIWDGTGNAVFPFFETPNLNGYALRMSIATTGASPAVKALETASWTWDTELLQFSGVIDLSQTDLVNALTGLEELDMKLDIKLVDPDGNRATILHENITVVRVADIVATPGAVQTDTYLTADEQRQMFVQIRHRGARTMVSEDGLTEFTETCVDGQQVIQGNAV